MHTFFTTPGAWAAKLKGLAACARARHAKHIIFDKKLSIRSYFLWQYMSNFTRFELGAKKFEENQKEFSEEY